MTLRTGVPGYPDRGVDHGHLWVSPLHLDDSSVSYFHRKDPNLVPFPLGRLENSHAGSGSSY